MEELRSALDGTDAAEIRAKSDSLMEASHRLAQAVYEKVQAEQTASAASGNGESASDDEVVEDADYEVIDEEAKQS
jgi:molecular chaperone DnaK